MGSSETIVSKVFDTQDYVTEEADWQTMGSAGEIVNGTLIGFHVTDDPDGLLEKLKTGFDVKQHGSPWEDLGPGLYVSANPDFWAGRSPIKWEFLKRLSQEEKQTLAGALLKSSAFEKGYTSKSEQEFAARIIEEMLDGRASPEVLIELAGQPYNVPFWRPSFLKPLGIQPSRQPRVVEIRAKGKFARLKHNPDEDQVKWLQKHFDGAFTPSSFGTTPQTVIYNQNAVVYAKEVGGMIQQNPRK